MEIKCVRRFYNVQKNNFIDEKEKKEKTEN